MASKGTCKLDGCEGEVRGKGYCDRHYRAWRRGKLPKPRYSSCNKADCFKPIHLRGLCAEHFQATYVKAKPVEPETPAEAPAPAAPTEAAPVDGGETTEASA
jgi:hypothetical protein